MARTDWHAETAAEFLARARGYLSDDDLLQASEKGWGAAAQMVKAAAEARGWNHSGQRQLHQTVERLVAETGQPELRTLFNATNTLHANFYDGFLPATAISADTAAPARVLNLDSSARPVSTPG